MSKNKRNRHRQALPESVLQNETSESNNSPTAIKSPRLTEQSPQTDLRKGGVLSYLKSHLLMVGIICFLALGALGAGLKYLDEDAKREIAKRANQKGNLNNQDQSFLNK